MFPDNFLEFQIDCLHYIKLTRQVTSLVSPYDRKTITLSRTSFAHNNNNQSYMEQNSMLKKGIDTKSIHL